MQSWEKNAVLDEWKLLATNICYSYGFDANTTTSHDDYLSHAFEVSVVYSFDRAFNSLLSTLGRISRWHLSSNTGRFFVFNGFVVFPIRNHDIRLG